jgi:RNA polymerase sigma-70 factor (ECF subfamily)
MEMARSAVASARSEAEVERLASLVTSQYERQGRILWGLARRLGASDEAAADVVQETHVRLWRELLDGTYIEDLDAWSFRVAYRLVMDQHRLGRRVRALAERFSPPQTLTHSGPIDEAVSLWPAVDQLPERERVTLYLRYRADLSFEQIAQVMGISAGGARTYASRGVERLRVAFSVEDGESNA